jgi:hypothetical protein
VAVLVGMLFWGWLWGICGLLLAVPMLTVIAAVCGRIDHLRPLAELLGERDGQPQGRPRPCGPVVTAARFPSGASSTSARP